jgi:hypothetical protein
MKAARWAPIGGVIYVVLWIVLFFLIGDDPGDSDAEISAWFSDSGNRDKQIFSFFLIVASSIFFVWFLAVLRGRLASAEGRSGTKTALAFGAGLVATALWTVSATFFTVISFAMDDSDRFVLDPNTARLVDNMGYPLWVSGTAIASLVVFATALASLRSQIVHKWLAWLSILVAATMLFSVVFIPFLIWMGWMLVVSLWMIWKPEGSSAAADATTS